MFLLAGFKGFLEYFGGGVAIEPQSSSSSLGDVEVLKFATLNVFFGTGTTVEPHRASFSTFGTLGGFDLDEFETIFHKIQ